MLRIYLTNLAVLSCLLVTTTSRADESALELFQQRIMPIFQSPKPSSCIQCHLSSVDLKDYILPSHKQTFLSLRDQGLIDFETPGDSKILKLIRMGDEDRDELAKRIHAKMRQAEYEAFAAWIAACCRDSALTSLPTASDSNVAKPSKPDVVIRHTRKDRLLDSFVRNVWSQRMRCFPCHTPGEIDDDNPQHEKLRERYDKFVEEYGGKMNVFRESPRETMAAWINSSRRPSKKHLPLLNFRDPPNSLIVLKPTAKLPAKTETGVIGKPSSILPVTHMGGLKMHVDDQSYKSILSWIEDCAKTIEDRYELASELPPDNWHPTKHVLRVKETPDSWPVGTVVQLFVHRWDPQANSWLDDPIAFTQGTVTPRRFVNGTLFLLDPESANETSEENEDYRIGPGKYQIKAYADTSDRIHSQPTLLLGEEDLQGRTEVDAKWGIGFKEAVVVEGSKIK